MLSAASTTREVSQAGERHQNLPHRRSRLGLSFLVCKTGRVLTFLYSLGNDSYIALHRSLGKGQKSFLPSESPRGAAGPLFNKRPPQICQGQPCQEKCLLRAGRPLRSRSCFDVLGAPKRGSSSIIHWKHLVEGSGSSRGLLPPPCPTARQPDNPAGCKEGPEAATRGTRPRPMSDTRPEEAELISEVCRKLWDARVQRVPHHSGVPTTLGSPQATPPPSPPHPMLPTLPGSPTRVSTVSDSPPRGPLGPRSPRSWGPSSWVPIPGRQNPGPGASAVARTARAHSPLPGARWARTLAAVRDTRRRACSRGPRGSWPGLLCLQPRLPRPPPGTWRAAPPGPLRPAARPGLSHNPCRRASLPASPTAAALPAPGKVWASAGCPRFCGRKWGARLRLLCRDAEVTPPARRCSWEVQVAL